MSFSYANVFEDRLKMVLDRIDQACVKSGRERAEVDLMAVTKRHSLEEIEPAVRGDIACFGENRVQEAAEKIPQLKTMRWELIGPLQTNKVRVAVELFDRIQTVDRLKLIAALGKQASQIGRDRLPVLLQVNVGADPAKSGCSIEAAFSLVEAIQETPGLQLDGLMTIGALTEDRDEIRRTFARLRELAEELRGASGLALRALSMGMTHDLEIAIEEGSTLIRVGSALFGARD